MAPGHGRRVGQAFFDSAKQGEALSDYFKQHTPCATVPYAAQRRRSSAQLYNGSIATCAHAR